MSAPSAEADAPIVSVVLPTYRRPALLDRCLAALVAQDLDSRAYEVVVADDANDPGTRRQVEARAARSAPAIRYVAVEGRHGPAIARNRGWLAAGPTALSEDAAGAWGRVVVPLPEDPTDYERDAAGLEVGPFATANCLYRRSALEAVGGFDERFTAAWREDSDLYLTLLARGARLVRAPDAVVLHPVRPAPFGVSLRQQRKARINALLYKKHPRLYPERIQGSPPWHYDAIVGALGAMLGGALAGRRAVAAAGLGAWTALTAAFCARRLGGTSRAPRHVAEMLLTSHPAGGGSGRSSRPANHGAEERRSMVPRARPECVRALLRT